jgi:hypothetical protein
MRCGQIFLALFCCSMRAFTIYMATQACATAIDLLHVVTSLESGYLKMLWARLVACEQLDQALGRR